MYVNGLEEKKEGDMHSLGKSVLFHLLPGIIVLLLYLMFIPAVRALGFPSILAIFLAVVFGVIPFQLGYVLYHAKKKNGRFSLKGAFPYDRKSPWWQYILVTVIYVAWSVLCFIVLPKFYSQFVMDHVFFWLPDWFIPNEGTNLTSGVILIILIAGFISDITGAIVEELYFRGILLPKVSWMGVWAPLITTLLFAAYHLDSPYKFIERFLSMLPIVFLVWWKKDLKMIILPHCTVNAIGMILFAMELL